MGCLFPKSNSLEAYWANIKAGVDAITDIPPSHWRPEDYFDADPSQPDMTYATRGGFLEAIDFDPLRYGINPNNIEATDTTQLLGMVAADQALRDAGYQPTPDDEGRPLDRARTSVILGVTGALELVIPLGARLGHPIWRKALADAGIEGDVAEGIIQQIADGYVPWQENSFPGLLGNVAAGRIANRFDLRGTNCVVDAACASSLSAIHLAAMELQTGRIDTVVAGGLDTFNSIFMYMCFSKTPALSPTGNSRPFAADGDGTILGEGLGVVVLKRLQDAERDGDRIYAVLKGMGTSSDGRGNAVYAPSAEGQSIALRSAYEQANVSPATIGLVEAHGTGTRVGDAIEIKALSGVYREASPQGTWCAVGSVKSMIGHTKAAAGVAGLMKATLALHHKVLPPTIKVDEPLEALTPNTAPIYLNTQTRPWLPSDDHPRRAAVSAFGFGGSNFHCVLEEHGTEKPCIEWDSCVLLYPLSAQTIPELTQALEAFDTKRSWADLQSEAAQRRRAFDVEQPARLVLVASQDETDLGKLISGVKKMLAEQGDQSTWSTPDGAHFGRGTAPGKLAVLFPGQGAQRPEMFRDLACSFPAMLKSFALADRAFANSGHAERLSEFVFPIPVFNNDERKEQDKALRDTRVAQPAIGAASSAMWQVLREFGVCADATAGHSFGELVALYAAEVCDHKALLALAIARGKLMAAGSGDRGTMLAVATTRDQVEAYLAKSAQHLVIANHNMPQQVVLSGVTQAIETAEAELSRQGIGCRRLQVSGAFHSELVADAEKDLARCLKEVNWQQGTVPVYANTTGQVYPQDENAARNLLAGQLARPVEFVRQIEQMYADGATTFLEVGPGKILSTLVRSILQDRPHHSIAVDHSRGRKPGQLDLASALAQLAALGRQVELQHWNPAALDTAEADRNRKPSITIPLTGANYEKPRPQQPRRATPEAQTANKTEKVAEPMNKPTTTSHTPASPGTPATPASNPAASAGPVPANQPQPNVAAPGTPSNLQASNSPAPLSPITHAMQPSAISNALQITQQSIVSMENMQQRNAELQRQFLEGQQATQLTIARLIEQQQQMLASSLGMASSAPMQAPASIPQAPAPFQPALPQAISPVSPLPQPSAPQCSAEPGPETERNTAATPVETPTAPQVQPTEQASDSGDTSISAVLLEVVAEKTGYPQDMLEMEMSLDADLGIDSIKRVEILSALQERLPDVPPVESDELGNFETLGHVLTRLQTAGPATNNGGQQNASSSVNADTGKAVVLEVVAEKTGYPVDMLELDMSLDADLGIDSIKRVEILSALQDRLPDAPAVSSEDLGKFTSLRDVVDFVGMDTAKRETDSPLKKNSTASSKPPEDLTPPRRFALRTCPTDDLASGAAISLSSSGPVWISDDGDGLAQQLSSLLGTQGVNCQVVALGNLPSTANSLAGLILIAPIAPNPSFAADAFELLKHSAAALKQGSKSRTVLLAGITRFDGHFGLVDQIINSTAGSLLGLIKTAQHEWPEIVCRTFDVPHERDNELAAEALLDVVLNEGSLETGLPSEGPISLVQDEVTATPRQCGTPPLQAEDVAIVTGGARGVTAEVAVAMAEAYHSTLVLAGRTAISSDEPGYLSHVEGEAAIKQAIAQNAPEKLTPRQLEAEYRQVAAAREVRDTIQRIENAGGRAIYRSFDVRDPAAITALVEESRQYGPVRGIVHGAGVLADRLIEDKTREQFDEVYSTKVTAMQALLESTKDDDLSVLAFFSSSTARYGRKGQADYAAANEVLNKQAHIEARRRPTCRVVSINWGPWDGGMVTPALKKLFAEEGVGVISTTAGAQQFLKEIAADPSGAVEIVVLGQLEGTAAQPHSNNTLAAKKNPFPSTEPMTVAFERELNIESYPFLRSHVLKGRAVLPVAIIIEWLAHGAMHNNPGMAFHGFDKLEVFKGVIIHPGERIALQIVTGGSHSEEGVDRTLVQLRSGDTLHAQAEILLAATLQPATASLNIGEGDPSAFIADGYYQDGRLFHGPDLQGIDRVEVASEQGAVAWAKPAPLPNAWARQPLRSTWLTDPLAIDSGFQLMILWCQEFCGRGSLPASIARYRQHVLRFGAEPIQVALQVEQRAEHTATATIEISSAGGQLLARMEGYRCVMDDSLADAFKQNQLAEQLQP